ncbi:redoxin domain-containing protein [Bdellovibrio sp. HCB290]|uniref:redoxin domain-containing protein n=1 Tax=Bdellovibrio sp. HCB290 TaxID=3394356 RepID=UPI0039B4C651
MKNLMLVIVTTLISSFAFADAKVGSPAPDFAVTDAQGKPQNLKDYKGKYVILEWYNKDCPYVRKHYDSKNMQKIQADMTGKGVVWLTVISSAKEKQGYLAPAEAIANGAKEASKASAILLDASGTMGKAYGAKTTPHMFLIDPEGKIRYAGAIDDNDSSDKKTVETAQNYIVAATSSAMKGEKIAKETSKPYGCSVKY